MSSAKQLGAQLQNYLVEVGCMHTAGTCSMHDAMALAVRVSPSLKDYKAYELFSNCLQHQKERLWGINILMNEESLEFPIFFSSAPKLVKEMRLIFTLALVILPQTSMTNASCLVTHTLEFSEEQHVTFFWFPNSVETGHEGWSITRLGDLHRTCNPISY
jgi:hypothetical protein